MKKDIGIAILLLVLCGITSYFNPRFLNAYNLENNARLIGMFGIFSIGVGVVIITGGIDLSVGSVFALQGILLAAMLRGGLLQLLPEMFGLGPFVVHVRAIPWPIAAAASIVALAILGVIHALLIVKVKLQPFIVTLCGLLIYRGLARFIASDETRGFGDSNYGILRGLAAGSIPVPMPFVIPLKVVVPAVIFAIWLIIPGIVYGQYLFFLGGRRSALPATVGLVLKIIFSAALCMLLSYVGVVVVVARFPYGIGGDFAIPMPFVIMVLVAVVMAIVIHKSVYGRYLFAVGRNEDAARYSGINNRLIVGSSYVICMLLTGIAGLILALDTNTISPSSFGASYELTGIAAAVLGGCSLRGGEGSVLGIVIGTALLVVLQNIVNLLGIDSSLNNAVMGGVILAGVLVDQLLAQRRNRRINPPAGGFPVIPTAAAQPVSTDLR